MSNSTVFATRCCTTTYIHIGLRLLGESVVGPSRKALTALQRGPRGIATSAPSQHDGVPVADPRRPRWSEKAAFLPENGHQKVAMFCRKRKPRGPYGVGVNVFRSPKYMRNGAEQCPRGPKTGLNGRKTVRDFVNYFSSSDIWSISINISSTPHLKTSK